jgi:hypothetical protein
LDKKTGGREGAAAEKTDFGDRTGTYHNAKGASSMAGNRTFGGEDLCIYRRKIKKMGDFL